MLGGEGGWKIKVIGSSNYEIEDSKALKIIHANRFILQVQSDHTVPQDRECNDTMWPSPFVQHEILFADPPLRQLQPPSV